MVKKYICTFVLLVAGADYAMELTVDVKPEQDYKCYWVARYVYKCSDKLDQAKKEKLSSFFAQKSVLTQKIQEYQDSMGKSDLEAEGFLKSLWDKKIRDAYRDYFYLSSGARYQVGFCLKNSPIASLLNKGKGIVTLDTVNTIVFDSCIKSVAPEGQVDEEIEDYYYLEIHGNVEKKNKKKAPSITNFEKFTVEQLLFLSSQNDFILNFKVVQKGDLYSAKIIPGIEFMLKAYPFKELLQKICRGSTAGLGGDVELRHKLTEHEQKQLKELHGTVKHLEEWQVLQHAAIGIDFRQPTSWERFKDRMLLAIPLCLAEGVIPQLIYKASLGKITCALGIVPCCITAGSLIGYRMFPFLDSYNSQLAQLRDVFGEDRVEKNQLGQAFFGYSVIHYMATILGEYFLSCGAYTVGSVFGIALYAARLYVLLYGIFSTKAHSRDFSIFGKIALCNPLLRKNKKYNSFTLGDLVK